MLQTRHAQNWHYAFEALGVLRAVDARKGPELNEHLFIYETRIAEFQANPFAKHEDGVYKVASE